MTTMTDSRAVEVLDRLALGADEPDVHAALAYVIASLREPAGVGGEFDAEAVAWAYGKLRDFGYYTREAGAMMGDRLNMMLLDPPAAPQPPAEAQPDPSFAEWLATEMPAGTVIGDPAWWANRIARQYAKRSSPAEAQPTPIGDLLADYEANGCDFTDLAWVRAAARGYVKTMPDSQVRCLLHVLARTTAEAQAQGGGEVVATVVTKLGRNGEVGEPVVMLEPAYEAWLDKQPPSTSHKLYTAPPSAPVGVEWLVSEWRTKAALCVDPDPGVQAAGAALECCADELEAALAQPPAAVDALAGLDNIAGYFQDGSEETLLVTPDDATRTWHVYVGKQHLGYGKSIRAALTAALAAQPEGSDNDR